MEVLNLNTNKRKCRDRIINLRISQIEEELLKKEAENRKVSYHN